MSIDPKKVWRGRRRAAGNPARIAALAMLAAWGLAAAGAAVARSDESRTRRVTREEVVAAIERTLRANWSASGEGQGAGEALSVDDVQLAAEVDVTESAPQLQVAQIQAAPDGATTRVLVWVTSEPRVPPFWVRVDRRIEIGDVSRRRELIGGVEAPMRVATAPAARIAIVPVSARMKRSGAGRGDALGAVLVKSGDPVELVVRVGGMRIQGTGIPLERGRRGDEVRVRAAPSGKVLVGTVVGEQIVQVSF
ncbi:MAG: flagella basal body P-ring formation protein FlgA [Candidatus Acidiferrales bacterium]